MKRNATLKTALLFSVVMAGSTSLFAQNWLLTGNAGTNPNTNYLGTSDNNSLTVRTNNVARLTVSAGTYSGVNVGNATAPTYLSVVSKDIVDAIMPMTITGNISGSTWGNNPGQTMGRLLRLNQGPSIASGGVNHYDFGIGQDTCFFITNHGTPPASGLGSIRKRMIVISPLDRVGINLAGTVTGAGAVPTANFHTNGTVRLQNLPSGNGSAVVIDALGNIYRSATALAAAPDSSLKAEVAELRRELDELRSLITSTKTGAVEVTSTGEKRLYQNAPNPFNESTIIKYNIPAHANQAYLNIADLSGKTVKYVNLSGQEKQVAIAAGELPAGTYFYSLIIDGTRLETKKMVLTR